MAVLLEKRKALHQRIEEIEEKYQFLEDSLSRLQPLANLGMAWAMTAHELNNLLMPTLNYSQLALQNPQDAALCEKALQKSLLLSTKAKDIMDKVMLLASYEQQHTIEKENLSLDCVIDDVLTCIGRDFQKDGIRLIRQIPKDFHFQADATAIQHVFMNLFLNARHAMLDRGGELKITAKETADGIAIEIGDTGRGIEPEQIKNIFTPFYTSGKQQGNGLGLAFCRKVIEMHHGYITIDSKPESGTRFRIMLPKYTV